ncbi:MULTISPECIES: hypothetical protein [Halomonadaceae]|uniref:hypothetical protein n=1 Tax=Halomonadaceae TaxID=28256 RepID=UPI001582534A|nr:MULTISPECIES: hypothetical protein [Halomonas]MDI4638907.1 hypothetical protein [Halomonas sp. BMC7]NUJ59897.1 hypothetical protein [Halomonas taeanensis]
MSELVFDTQEFLDAANELVPDFQRNKVVSAINNKDMDESDFDQIGLKLTGETRDSGLVVPTSAQNGSDGSIWGAIKGEVYDYLCTKSRKYSKERKEAGISVKNLIMILATAVASSFNVAVGVVTGAVTIAVLSALKIGKNAWCEMNRPAEEL